MVTLFTMPLPEQYGQGSHSVRSRDWRTRLRVRITRPNSFTERTFDGERSCCSSCSRAAMTFCRLFFSSMSMKSTTMIPPRSRRRICRTISLTASTLVLRIVSSSLFFPV